MRMPNSFLEWLVCIVLLPIAAVMLWEVLKFAWRVIELVFGLVGVLFSCAWTLLRLLPFFYRTYRWQKSGDFVIGSPILARDKRKNWVRCVIKEVVQIDAPGQQATVFKVTFDSPYRPNTEVDMDVPLADAMPYEYEVHNIFASAGK